MDARNDANDRGTACAEDLATTNFQRKVKESQRLALDRDKLYSQSRFNEVFCDRKRDLSLRTWPIILLWLAWNQKTRQWALSSRKHVMKAFWSVCPVADRHTPLLCVFKDYQATNSWAFRPACQDHSSNRKPFREVQANRTTEADKTKSDTYNAMYTAHNWFASQCALWQNWKWKSGRPWTARTISTFKTGLV